MSCRTSSQARSISEQAHLLRHHTQEISRKFVIREYVGFSHGERGMHVRRPITIDFWNIAQETS